MMKAQVHSSKRRHIPQWLGYAVVVLLEVLLTALLIGLHPHMPIGQFPFAYIIIIVIAAYLQGTGPAVLAFVLGWFSYTFFFLSPTYRFWPPATTSQGWASQIVFLVGSGTVAASTILLRRSREYAQGLLADYEYELAERRRVEAESRRLISILECAPDIIATADPEGHVFYLNKAAREVLGARNGESGRTIWEGHPPWAAELVRTVAIPAAIRTGTWRGETAILSADGLEIPVSQVIVAHRSTDGKVEYLSTIARDITERKQNEEALRDTTQRLNSLLEYSPLALVEWDSESRIVRWTDEAQKVFGWSAGEVLGKRVDEFRFIHEDDADRVSHVMGDMVRGPRLRTFSRNRNYRKDGSVIHCDWYNSAIRDSSGKVASVLSLALDVTARLTAEEQLRFQSDILSQVNDAVVATDKDRRIIYCNRALERIFGLECQDVIGKHVDELTEYQWVGLTSEHRVLKAIERRGCWRGEGVVYKPSGEQAYVESSVSLLKDPSGDSVGYLAVIRDATRRKEAEKALRKSEANRREFYRRTIHAATEGKLIIADHRQIERIAGPPVASWEICDGSDLAVIRHGVADAAHAAGMNPDRLELFLVCVGEATTNAYKHAGLGTASLHRTCDSLIIMVSDRGHGIEALSLPEVALKKGYSTAGTLGMGYKVMISYGDKVYLDTGPKGTTVAVEMKLHEEAAIPPSLDILSTVGW